MFGYPVETNGRFSLNNASFDFLFVKLSDDKATLKIYSIDLTIQKDSIAKKLKDTHIPDFC